MYAQIVPSFAERFKELRGPLTQRDVGYRLDITDGMIQKWERGSSLPSLENLHRIADLTGVSLDYITGRSDERGDDPKWWLPAAPGPGGPSADLDAASQQRRRGDERRVGRSRPRRP